MFKKFSTMTLFGLFTVAAVYAQSNPIQVKIPFAFTVHNEVLAAGNYQLTYSTTAHILFIHGLDQNSGGVFTTAVSSARADGPGKLVFNCYDKKCYLAHVAQAAAAGGSGLQVPQGEQERRIAMLTREVSMTIATK